MGNYYHKGYVSKYNPSNPSETPRGTREKRDMEKKLHYQSCYFFFFLKSKGISPNEVQMMCAENKKSEQRFFLAVNNRIENGNSIKAVRKALSINDKNIFTVNLNHVKNDIIRESEKGGERKVKTKITNALRSGQYFDLGNITFVSHNDRKRNAYDGRHLCDKAKNLKHSYKFYIYGKRRPCITCAARMEVTKIDNYNKKHGRLFRHTTKNLTPEQAHEVIRILVEEPSYITQRSVKTTTTHYASDTDDEEKPKKQLKISSKKKKAT